MKHRHSAAGAPPSSLLEYSLRRVLKKQKLACKKLESNDAVHDFRVALRRCRSLAEVLSDLDPHPVWSNLQKVCKKQQRGVTDLRDVQVMLEWIRALGLGSGSGGAALTESLKKEARRARRKAAAALAAFPRKRWKHWLHTLPVRADLIPAGEARLATVALDRLTEARELERRWRKVRGPQAWHNLRIGVKRYRYTVESVLPEKNAAWNRGLKGLQDVLGEAHDLDVLRAKILEWGRGRSLPQRTRDRWMKRIDRARRERVSQYEEAILLASTSRKPSASSTLWDRLRLGLEPLTMNSNS